jgi:DNA ligase-1
MEKIREWYEQQDLPHVALVDQEKCKGIEHLKKRLSEVEELGGEGLMLREPKSLYIGSRSNTLLKVKTFHDAEAKVLSHEPGKGKHQGKVGALWCDLGNGKKFSVGSG